MSVLIKGIQMPKDCATCLMCDKGADGMWYCVATMTNLSDKLGDMLFFRPDWCPFVEVSTPHGRLIDADAFRRRCLEAIPYGFASEDEIRAYNKILGLLKDAPTIIEAEE